jgi:hypothetical protein
MLEVSVEQTIISEFILRSVSSGVTLSTIPYMTDENLTKVYWTPSVSCGPTLQSVSLPPGVNLLYPPGVDSKRHDTYILLKVLFIHEGFNLYFNLLVYHGSVTYPNSGKNICMLVLNHIWSNMPSLHDNILFSTIYVEALGFSHS